MDVDSLSYPRLVERYELKTIDLLHTDAEGYDGVIIRQVDLTSAGAPPLRDLRAQAHGRGGVQAVEVLLKRAGYRLVGLWPDQLAYRSIPSSC